MSSEEAEKTQRIRAEAAEWFAQKDAGLAAEQQQKFEQWLERDAAHREEFRRLESCWSQLLQLREYRPAAAKHPDPQILRGGIQERATAPRWSTPLLTMAAVLVLTLFGIWMWSHMGHARSAAVDRLVHATAPGGYERIALVDGSAVELNGDTEVLVEYTARERKVILSRGEAHFSVAKNPQVPFRVVAGDTVVEAIGTAFNVRRAAAAVEVLVTSGVVKVAPPHGASSDPLNALTSGWRAVISEHPQIKNTVEQVNPERVRALLAWQPSRLVFSEIPLHEVAEQFNQRNIVQLEIRGEDLRQIPVGGTFDAHNVEAFVRLLSSSGEIIATRPSDQLIVLQRAP
jgi:transmembrane sensor